MEGEKDGAQVAHHVNPSAPLPNIQNSFDSPIGCCLHDVAYAGHIL